MAETHTPRPEITVLEVITMLKNLGYRKFPTLSMYLRLQDAKLSKSTDEYNLYGNLKKYDGIMQKPPEITDFINYDYDGNPVLNNSPIFKGWKVAKESGDTKKVAELVTTDKKGVTKRNLIYFGTPDGVIISSDSHMSDQATYETLAYFFEGELKLA